MTRIPTVEPSAEGYRLIATARVLERLGIADYGRYWRELPDGNIEVEVDLNRVGDLQKILAHMQLTHLHGRYRLEPVPGRHRCVRRGKWVLQFAVRENKE